MQKLSFWTTMVAHGTLDHRPLRIFLHCSLPDFDFSDLPRRKIWDLWLSRKSLPMRRRIRFRPETASQTSIAASSILPRGYGDRRAPSFPTRTSFVEKLLPSLAQTIAYIAEQIAANHQPLSSAFRARNCRGRNTCEHRRSTFVPFAQWIDSKQVYDSAKLADRVARFASWAIHARRACGWPPDHYQCRTWLC